MSCWHKGTSPDDKNCRALAQAALDKRGRIDALINNAGITKFASASDLDVLDAEDFQRIYAVNVIGAYQMTRACGPATKAQGMASIVNISSLSGVRGVGSSTAYIASKGALNAMTLALARALAPEIRVNAVCPGLIDTRWRSARSNSEDYEKFKAAYENTLPLENNASPDDVADVVLWLLEGATLVTGKTSLVDGGFRLGKWHLGKMAFRKTGVLENRIFDNGILDESEAVVPVMPPGTGAIEGCTVQNLPAWHDGNRD